MTEILKRALTRTNRGMGAFRPAPVREPVSREWGEKCSAWKTGPLERVRVGKVILAAGKEQSPPAKVGKKVSRTRKVELDHQILEENKIALDHQTGLVADQVKILRTQLLQRLQQRGGNSVLFTSARPGEGKTLNAINTAISIAQEVERTVLLIDANLRQPAIHKYLGIAEGLGLADYLLGRAEIGEILVNPGIEKLTLLPGGRPLATSSEMLGATRMSDLVQEMKYRYEDRILVFDGPDILTNADALVFSRLVDGVVLVVEAEKTTRQSVQQALERLGENCHLLGTVFNRSYD